MQKKRVSLIFRNQNLLKIVKYGTLTCANGLISLDIYQKDVMLIVMACILILQGKKDNIKCEVYNILVVGGIIFGTIKQCRKDPREEAIRLNQCKFLLLVILLI